MPELTRDSFFSLPHFSHFEQKMNMKMILMKNCVKKNRIDNVQQSVDDVKCMSHSHSMDIMDRATPKKKNGKTENWEETSRQLNWIRK